MGLFKKSYVERIKDISKQLHEVDLTEDDLILNFRSKVKEIEEYDIEFIRLLQRLSREGHLSEKMKRALLNQLLSLLRRLENLDFENKEKLQEIRREIEDILKLELTVERIGIEMTNPIYHGAGISDIQIFEPGKIDFERLKTLDVAIYCTDNKQMAINYANFRYGDCLNNEEVKAQFGERIKITVYTIRLKKGKNYVADLNDPIKLRVIYKDLREYCLKVEPRETRNKSFERVLLIGFSHYLEFLIKENILFKNIRLLLEGTPSYKPGKNIDYRLTTFGAAIYYITDFLKKYGFHGLRCEEAGEPEDSIYPWEPSMSYVIFNPDDTEIMAEEHFGLKNGKVIRLK